MDLVLSSLPLPVRLRPARPMSDDQLVEFSRANRSLRVEREATGEILVMTPTGPRTGRMNLRIGRLFDEWAEEDGRGVAFDSSTGFKLPSGAVRSPDVSWAGNGRWNALTEEEQDRFILSPDFVVELRSPIDRLADVREKMEEWIVNGVELGG